MKQAAYNIMPATENILKTLGEQIKLARLRRNLTAELVAERAGISRYPYGRWSQAIRLLLWGFMLRCFMH